MTSILCLPTPDSPVSFLRNKHILVVSFNIYSYLFLKKKKEPLKINS